MFSIDFSRLSVKEIQFLAQQKLTGNIPIWERNIWQFLQKWLDESVDSIDVYTSGSTGPPQKISHLKTSMVHSARMTCRALNLQRGNRALLCLPVERISGMMMLVRSAEAGLYLDCIRPSLHPLKELTEEYTVDFSAFTPLQFSDILDEGGKCFNRAEKIKKVILGGEAIHHDLMEKIKWMKNEVYATFGMTETVSHIALKKMSGSQPDSCYHTLPDIRVSMDSDNRLIIHASKLGHESLFTNDIVKVSSETEFEWLGRTDNVINRGGVKVHPEIIEKQLARYIRYPFFIAEITTRTHESKLALVIETSLISMEEKTWIQNGIEELEKLSRPQIIYTTPLFIRTENGKIKRKESLQSAIFNAA